jgi:ABC-type transport system involved in multi-copper enzyme maturation permease subunit
LTTGLSDHEIVVGKLVAGLARVALLLLTGLPVLALMQLWGGIEPKLVFAGYAATVVGMVSVGALAVLCSVHARKLHEAVVMTYLVMIAFTIVSLLCRFAMRDSVLGLCWPAWIGDGNILVVLYQLRRNWQSGALDNGLLLRLLLHFGVFHATATIACLATAVLKLRRAASPRVRPAAASWPAHLQRRLLRSVLARWPMLWKEIGEPRFSLGRIGWCCVILIVLATLVPALWPSIRSLNGGYDPWYQLKLQADTLIGLDIWGRLVATSGACLALLSVAIHAAGSISRERERHTLDSLLTTPLTPKEIQFAKWLGSILSVRRCGLILVGLWLLCCGASGASCLTLIAGLVAWLVYAGCGAMLGLLLSMTIGRTPWATLYTLAALCVLAFGHWLPSIFVRSPMQHQLPRTVASFGLTPPAALHWLALNGDDANGSSARFYRFTSGEYSLRPLRTRASPSEPRNILTGIAAGLLFWSLLTVALWLLAVRRLTTLRPYRREPEMVTDTEEPRSTSSPVDARDAAAELLPLDQERAA